MVVGRRLTNAHAACAIGVRGFPTQAMSRPD